MEPILVTGASGAVGSAVVERLRKRGLPVRAVVRRDDERAAGLRQRGADVVTGDLTIASDVMRVMRGCTRIYFGLSVASYYLEATVLNAAAAKELGGLEVFVNMSQMTVSQMSLGSTTESSQQQQHFLAERVLSWSGLPVVYIRPTVFLQSFRLLTSDTVRRDGTIRLPFAEGRTSPVDVSDVADVIAAVLADPTGHIGHVYELTGPKSMTMNELAAEYTTALGRPIRYIDMPYELWRQSVRALGFPEHVFEHLSTIARLHAQNRYDRHTDDVEEVAGHPAVRARDYVARHAAEFGATSTSSPSPAPVY